MHAPIAVSVHAGDRLSEAGVAAELATWPEVRIVASAEEAIVALVVADEVGEEALRMIRAASRAGGCRIVLVVTRIDDRGLLVAVEELKKRQDADKKIISLEYNLRPQLYLQSVNENVGDALHTLHAYHHIPRYSVYRAGKYFSRLTEATEKALDSTKPVPHFTELKEIGRQAMAIKSKTRLVRGRKVQGDPRFMENSDFFKNFDVSKSGIDDLRRKIIDFGASVPALFHARNALIG